MKIFATIGASLLPILNPDLCLKYESSVAKLVNCFKTELRTVFEGHLGARLKTCRLILSILSVQFAFCLRSLTTM